jgi:hypothetical protein
MNQRIDEYPSIFESSPHRQGSYELGRTLSQPPFPVMG